MNLSLSLRQFAQHPDDNTHTTSNKFLVLIISLCCSVCGLIWGLIYYLVFGYGVTMLLPLVFTFIVSSAILVSHYIRNHFLLIYTQIVCITWITAMIQWSIGSLDQSGIVIVWSFLGPLGALIFLSNQEAILWMALFICIVIISAVYEPSFFQGSVEVSKPQRTWFYIMNLGTASLIVFAASLRFVNTIQIERGRVEHILDKVKTLFGQHVSSEIMNELIKGDHQKIESKAYDATILFLDIRDFTKLADARAPSEVATFQNTVISELINIVRDHRGIVVQILGDGIYAVFGAPVVNDTHVKDAITAGHAMIDKTLELGKEGVIPPIRVGIGIHTGKVIAGELGNKYRKSYSLAGTTVIIASRIEQLNKELKSQFLISETAWSKSNLGDQSGQFMGNIELKGISEAVGIYQLR